MDNLVETLASLGIPGLVLSIGMSLSGYAGAAALTTTLAALGPFGMVGGIAMLILISILARYGAKYGFETIAKLVLKELLRGEETFESIVRTIEGYPISRDLKHRLINWVNQMSGEVGLGGAVA